MWIIGRIEYISTEIGLRWAEGVAATLKGDFAIHDADLLDYEEVDGKAVQVFWQHLLETVKNSRVPILIQ
jgi:hypothetical protein